MRQTQPAINARLARFLLLAHSKGHKLVSQRSLGDELRIVALEADDLANLLVDQGLAERHDFVNEDSTPDIPSRVLKFSLTKDGREVARQLIEDKQQYRRQLFWTILVRCWAIALTIAVPVCVAWLNRKIEAVEQRQSEVATASDPYDHRPQLTGDARE